MKVNKIPQNYAVSGSAALLAPKGKNQSTPNFKGGAQKITDVMIEHLPGKNGIKAMQKMQWFDSEEGRILTTALGTGLIAPIFIAWNPYVKAKPDATPEEKKDMENTKKYTAWRQPISAVLAIIFQLSVLKPINKFLNYMFNNPAHGKKMWLPVDQSALNTDKYLEDQAKKEIKKQNLKFNNKKEKVEWINNFVAQRSSEQISDVAAKLKSKGYIDINGRQVSNKDTAELLNSSVDNYIKSAKSLQISTEDGLNFYTKRAKLLVDNEKQVKQLMNEAIVHKDDVEGYLKTKLDSVSEDLKEVLQEIIDLPDNKSRISRCQRTIDRIAKVKDACGGTFDPEVYKASMRQDNDILRGYIDRLEQTKLKPEKATQQEINDGIRKAAEACHYNKSDSRLNRIFNHTNVFNSDKNELIDKICKDITKGWKGVVDKRYRFWKEVFGITIGLFITVPLTCNALNWVYPRFMEIFMPNLVGNSKNKNPNKVPQGGVK